MNSPSGSRPKMKKLLKRDKPVMRSFFIDPEGYNKLWMSATPNRKTIYLQLQGEGEHKRYVGTVTLSTRTIEIKRDRDKHLLRARQAYGFNEYILSNAKSFNMVWLRDQHEDWKIPVKDILENGKYLQFKQQGYELQKFLTLDELAKYRVIKKRGTRL